MVVEGKRRRCRGEEGKKLEMKKAEKGRRGKKWRRHGGGEDMEVEKT